MAAIGQLNSANFDSEVLQSSTPMLVYFISPWCGPCETLNPIVVELAAEWSDRIKVAKLDIYESFGVTLRYAVMKAPTLMLFINGQVVERVTGFAPKHTLIGRFAPHLKQSESQ